MIFLAVLPLFLIILLSPLGIDINYLRENKKDRFYIKFKFLWDLIKIPLNIEKDIEKVKEIKEEKKININYLKLFSMSPVLFNNTILFIKNLKGKIICSDFYLKANFSLCDAALTGLASGALRSSLSSLLIISRNYLKYKVNPKIALNPIFNEKGIIEVLININLRVRLVHIILSSLLTLIIILIKKLNAKKNKLRRVKRWKNTPYNH